jgi:hypothetical protein
MPNSQQDEPATLMNWLQLFGFLMTTMAVSYVVVSVFSFIFAGS